MIDKAIAWAGIMILFNFTTWDGNVFSWYRTWLDKSDYRIVNAFGLCIVCTGFWWGIPAWYYWGKGDYFVFMGISEGILVLYSCLLLRWFK